MQLLRRLRRSDSNSRSNLRPAAGVHDHREELQRKVTISSTVAENSIPADLIVNWDQTGVRMVPVNDWTMTTRGSKKVFVTV